MWKNYHYHVEGLCYEHNFFTKEDPFYTQNFIIDEAFMRSKRILSKQMNSLGKGKPNLIISERSLLSNMHTFIAQEFDSEELSPLDFNLLNLKSQNFYEILLKDFKLKPYSVLLDDSVTNLLNRIKARNRQGEETLDKKHLSNLSVKYRNYYLEDKVSHPSMIISLKDHMNQEKIVDHLSVIRMIRKFLFKK